MSFPVQQGGAEFPDLPGQPLQHLLHLVLLGAVGLHSSVPVEHTDVAEGLLVHVEFPVSHQKAGLLQVRIVPVDAEDGLRLPGQLLGVRVPAVHQGPAGPAGLEALQVRKIDIGHEVGAGQFIRAPVLLNVDGDAGALVTVIRLHHVLREVGRKLRLPVHGVRLRAGRWLLHARWGGGLLPHWLRRGTRRLDGHGRGRALGGQMRDHMVEQGEQHQDPRRQHQVPQEHSENALPPDLFARGRGLPLFSVVAAFFHVGLLLVPLLPESSLL